MLEVVKAIFEDALSLVSLMLFGGVLLLWVAIAETLLHR